MDSNAARFFDYHKPQAAQAPRASGEAVDVVLERFDLLVDLRLDRLGHRGMGELIEVAFPSPNRYGR